VLTNQVDATGSGKNVGPDPKPFREALGQLGGRHQEMASARTSRKAPRKVWRAQSVRTFELI